jgi:hypothetical protein
LSRGLLVAAGFVVFADWADVVAGSAFRCVVVAMLCDEEVGKEADEARKVFGFAIDVRPAAKENRARLQHRSREGMVEAIVRFCRKLRSIAEEAKAIH